MGRVSRFKKRESDRSGFDGKEIHMVRDGNSLVLPSEFDAPPPSKQSLGGEGDFTVDGRDNSDFTIDDITTVPPESALVTFQIDEDEIKWTDSEPWIRIEGSGGSVDLANDPQITPAPHETFLTIECISNNKVTIVDARGVSLRTPVYTMDSGAILNLVYNATDGLWVETSRSHRRNIF